MPEDVPLDDEERGRALYLARREEARAAVRRMIENARTAAPALIPLVAAVVGALFGESPTEIAA